LWTVVYLTDVVRKVFFIAVVSSLVCFVLCWEGSVNFPWLKFYYHFGRWDNSVTSLAVWDDWDLIPDRRGDRFISCPLLLLSSAYLGAPYHGVKQSKYEGAYWPPSNAWDWNVWCLDIGTTLYLPCFISGSEGGWYHIAWAFLKPVGANGVLNTEKEVRLQLYKPQRIRRLSCNSCDVCYCFFGTIQIMVASTGCHAHS